MKKTFTVKQSEESKKDKMRRENDYAWVYFEEKYKKKEEKKKGKGRDTGVI